MKRPHEGHSEPVTTDACQLCQNTAHSLNAACIAAYIGRQPAADLSHAGVSQSDARSEESTAGQEAGPVCQHPANHAAASSMLKLSAGMLLVYAGRSLVHIESLSSQEKSVWVHMTAIHAPQLLPAYRWIKRARSTVQCQAGGHKHMQFRSVSCTLKSSEYVVL